MSRPASSFCSENAEPSCSNSEHQIVHIARDHNVNTGSGSFIVNNVQQARTIPRHIEGTEEEEAEYGQYGEYRRSDVRLLKTIHTEKLVKWDKESRRHVPFDCERSIWFGEIVSGVEKGRIVTVVSYQGRDAPEKWKSSFQRHSGHLCDSSAHLLALNRSKIPLLILLGEILPAAVFRKKIGEMSGGYLHILSVSTVFL
ncbi:hypothetical protein PM082_007011 [Marasmius tenuissimus]|nr:hypothetical protein PM082_007011 [Marasmius tenuissimus]